MNKGFTPPPHPACPPDRAAGTLQRGVRPSPKGRHTKSCGGQRHESDNEKIRFVVISPHPVVISGRTRTCGGSHCDSAGACCLRPSRSLPRRA